MGNQHGMSQGMDYETLKVEIGADRVGIVTMSRPEVRNAMNTAMMRELRDLFAQLLRRPRRRRLPGPDRRARRLLQRRRPARAQGHDGRRLAPAARRRRADGARHPRLPDPDRRRRQRRGLRRRHGAGAGLRLRLRRAIGAVCPDRGDARHPAGRLRHAEPAARRRRAPRQGADPHRHAVHGRAGAGVGHGQQGVPRRSS